MLISFRKGAAAFAAVATILATSAHAETHTVLIMDSAYFPAVTYVKPGDSIIFSNKSSMEHTVTAENASWSTGAIVSGGNVTVAVVPEMQSAFQGAAQDAVMLEGNLNFSMPPLN